jgi:septal ring factor EnvC (AmiA/AmiB activator)
MTTSKVISNKHFLALAICGVLASVSLAHAQNADNDVLRRTQMQLRQSEQERNSLRSELARLQAQLDGQRVEFDRMRQQAVQVKGDNHSNEAELVAKTSRLNQATQQLKDTREELERLRADSARSSQAVQNMKSMLDNAEKNSALMQELVGLCRDRNQEMYSACTRTRCRRAWKNRCRTACARTPPISPTAMGRTAPGALRPAERRPLDNNVNA